jgi:hypothetical protein
MMTCSSAYHAPVVPGLAGTRVVLAAAGVPWQPRQSSWTHSPHEILEHAGTPASTSSTARYLCSVMLNSHSMSGVSSIKLAP